MKTVFYYTSSYLLDISLEMINALKKRVNLHVFIEITQNSKNFNILEISELPDTHLASPEEILDAKQLKLFSSYFDGCRSVSFVIHPHPNGLSWKTLAAAWQVRKKIKKFRPDVLHFESFSMRTIGLAPALFGKKRIILSIHDATPHSGENHWKSNLPRKFFMWLPFKKKYLFYSKFTRNEFLKNYSVPELACKYIEMPSYSFFRNFAANGSTNQHILFFGRISKYKGIPMLLDAMPQVWEEFPDTKLIIAGNGNDPAVNDHAILNSNPQRITFLNRYIPNDELVQLIRNSIVIVCPYTDASQSGVLMTAFGLKKPVIATNVGAFCEFISDGVNGFLTEGNPDSIGLAIKKTLTGGKFTDLERNLTATADNENYNKNGALLLKAYDISSKE